MEFLLCWFFYLILRDCRKKVISLLFRFDIAILIFWIIQSLLNIKSYSITDVLWAMTTIGGIGNSNWFIISIVLLYLSTLISRALFKMNLPQLFLISYLL